MKRVAGEMADELVCDTSNGVIDDLNFIPLIGCVRTLITRHLSLRLAHKRGLFILNLLNHDGSAFKTHLLLACSER